MATAGRRRILEVGWIQRLLAPLLSIYLRLVCRSCVVDVYGSQNFERRLPCVVCFWHGRLATMLLLWLAFESRQIQIGSAWPLEHRFRALVSSQAEGLLFNEAINRLGISTILRKAGTRGIGAIRDMRKTLSGGDSIFFAADGPRGPAFTASRAAIRLAQATGVPLMAVGCAPTRRTVFATWDRFVLPLPFGRLVYVIGSPLFIGSDADEAGIEAARRDLDGRLNAVTDEAEHLAGNTPGTNLTAAR